MTILNKSLITVVAILIMGCSGKMAEQSSADPGFKDMIVNSPEGKSTGGAKELELNESVARKEDDKGGDKRETAATEKKLIKNGEVGFQVNSLAATKQKIVVLLKVNGGYIAKENS
jgi:hypothetical protein